MASNKDDSFNCIAMFANGLHIPLSIQARPVRLHIRSYKPPFETFNRMEWHLRDAAASEPLTRPFCISLPFRINGTIRQNLC